MLSQRVPERKKERKKERKIVLQRFSSRGPDAHRYQLTRMLSHICPPRLMDMSPVIGSEMGIITVCQVE